jgi:hypothetical protein
MKTKKPSKKDRTADPYLDRRSGEERRQAYDADYFENGGTDRRKQKERRKNTERRKDCIPVSDWTSICPDDEK